MNDSPSRERRDPIRPRSRIAIDGIGDEPGAGRGIVGLCGGSLRPSPRFRCRSRGRSRATSSPTPPPGIPRPPPPRTPAAASRPPRSRRARSGARDPPACGLAAAARKPVTPAAIAATSSTSQADTEALENVIELVRKHKPGGRDPGAGRDIGSGRQEARGMDHPAQRRQRRVGRALSRLHLGQSELAVADLPAPAHRGGAVGRPSRRRHGVGMVRKRIAALGQGQVLAGARDDRARRPRQCRASGARGLAKRFACRRIPRARRSTCSARC